MEQVESQQRVICLLCEPIILQSQIMLQLFWEKNQIQNTTTAVLGI